VTGREGRREKCPASRVCTYEYACVRVCVCVCVTYKKYPVTGRERREKCSSFSRMNTRLQRMLGEEERGACVGGGRRSVY
jgi:hypothetical protein